MALRPLHSCRHPGCPALLRGPVSYCPAHQPPRWRTAPEDQRQYDSAKHRTWWRKAVLAEHPTCPCGAPATVADHIVSLKRGGEWGLDNGQGLCLRCHQSKRGRERHGS